MRPSPGKSRRWKLPKRATLATSTEPTRCPSRTPRVVDPSTTSAKCSKSGATNPTERGSASSILSAQICLFPLPRKRSSSQRKADRSRSGLVPCAGAVSSEQRISCFQERSVLFLGICTVAWHVVCAGAGRRVCSTRNSAIASPPDKNSGDRYVCATLSGYAAAMTRSNENAKPPFMDRAARDATNFSPTSGQPATNYESPSVTTSNLSASAQIQPAKPQPRHGTGCLR